jgi:ATP-dependent Clp protease ATP-binding subunit ClpA
LHHLGVNLPKLSDSLEVFLREHAGSYKGNAVFSQRTITLLDAAYKEVKRLHHREIGTTHLLIALSQDRGAFLKSIFEMHELDSKKIRDTFVEHLKGYSNKNEESGIQIKRGDPSASAAQIVPPVFYSDTVKRILKNAEFTAQALGDEQLRPAHLLYSSCVYPLDWWDKFAEAGIEPHAVSGKLARLMRREGMQQSEQLALSPEACAVFGRCYALTLLHGEKVVMPARFLQAVLESDDPLIPEVFAETPDALAKLLELVQTDTAVFPETLAEGSGINAQSLSARYEKLKEILLPEPDPDIGTVEPPKADDSPEAQA